MRYAELARALGVPEGGRAPLADVRSAVLGLRRGKGMVLDPGDPDTRSAGSFFPTPSSTPGSSPRSSARRGPWRAPGTRAALPGRRRPGEGVGRLAHRAGRLPEGLSGRGAGTGPAGARISSKHTLALVNPGGATTAGLLALAREIREGVRAAFGVELASEPVLVGAGL